MYTYLFIFLLLMVIISTGLVGFTCYVFLHTVSKTKGKTKTKLEEVILNVFRIKFEFECEDNSKE